MDEDFLVKKTKKEEEKRKKRGFLYLIGIRNTRLAFLIVAFIFTLVLLSTSTYAWFTSNETVSVQEIDVNVSSGSGIQISTDAENWKSMITIDDITSSALTSFATNQVPATNDQMNPVSTVKTAYAAATTYSQGLHMYKGTIVNDENDGTMYLNSVSETDGANTDYIAFDFYLKLDFKSDEGPKQIYFTSDTGVTAGSPNTSIEYAARMGFVIQGSDASSASLATLRGLNGATGIYIYEPNYDVHTNNGLANGRNNYAINGYGINNNASAVPYYGVKAAFAYDPSATPIAPATNNPTGVVLGSTDSAKFEAVTPDFKTVAGNNEAFSFTALPVGVTKIRVYMWIEGQDIDCENTASGGQVKFNLGFTLNAPTTPTPTPNGG